MKNNQFINVEQMQVKHVQVEFDEKKKLALEESIQAFLKDDVLALKTIKPLLITGKTFENSLGELYSYQMDRNECLSCQKKLLSCPKKDRKGYVLVPYYEKEADRIRLTPQPCIHLNEMNHVLERIKPCDCSHTSLVVDANSLLDSLLKGDNIKKQQGLSSVFLSALNIAKKNEKAGKGIMFSTVNGGSDLSSSLLRLLGYVYAKSEFSVAYINAPKFFSNLFSSYDNLSFPTIKELPLLMKADVLLLENLDKIVYLNDEKLDKYLFPLLRERKKEGKINYASLEKPKGINTIIYSNRRVLHGKDELYSLLSDLFDEKVIQDLDLR